MVGVFFCYPIKYLRRLLAGLCTVNFAGNHNDMFATVTWVRKIVFRLVDILFHLHFKFTTTASTLQVK